MLGFTLFLALLSWLHSPNSAHAALQDSHVNTPDVSALFKVNCAKCHGQDGRAKTSAGEALGARDFSNAPWQERVTDKQIIASITHGLSNKMPAFGSKLSETEIRLLTTYVRTLRFPGREVKKQTASSGLPGSYVGNSQCALCHQSIYRSYSRHPMALDSGLVDEIPSEGLFSNNPSSIRYRIYKKNDKAFYSYGRAGEPLMHGEQELKYFIGSGKRGRSYLYSLDGFLYQSPVSYYAQKKKWDVSPGYESEREMPSRPIEVSCLYCHASQVQHINDTLNRYGSPPFLYNGISCERCHGPGGEHVKGVGRMVNPAKLSPERRDSICARCHLSGEASIQQPGKNLNQFKPGDLLSDYISEFVYKDEKQERLRAVSHVVAITQSMCKQRSGDRMSCLSCHDAHSTPSVEGRAAYFREKCLVCHEKQTASKNLEQHYAKNYDCAGCHMRKTLSLDINHTMVTDHRILRKPVNHESQQIPEPTLIQFGSPQSNPRDLGLAYAELALRPNHPFYQSEAYRLLSSVLPLYPKDAEVLAALAHLHHVRGEIKEAMALYEATLQVEPHRIVPAINLGAIYAQSGRVEKAISLWQGVLEENPGVPEAGVDLSLALCAKGNREQAREVLLKVLYFNPDLGIAKQMLRELNGDYPGCRSNP